MCRPEDVELLLPLGGHGVVVHCISGWDRTPLFISLVRLWLWADGLVHESLRVDEVIFLTVATDWMLFGHDFYTRYRQQVELLLFCFSLLEAAAAFVLNDRHTDEHLQQRASRLQALRDTFLGYYHQVDF